MDVIIDCYFDQIFSQMERSSLLSRYKRRALVNYITAIIQGCAREEPENTEICEKAVLAVLRYHNITLDENGSICLLGKFHNVLYVGLKLCFDWQLENNEIVSRLLNDIYYCEKTFERLFVGAIFGTRVTHFLSGWKSDFEDQEENVRALVYFMDHANKARLRYATKTSGSKCRFVDVPMESYGQALPIRVAIQLGNPDILLLLLRYGALTNSDNLYPSPTEMLLNKFADYETGDDEQTTQYPPQLLSCLRLLLRTTPTVTVNTPDHIADRCGVLTITLKERYPNLVDNRVVPADRSGVSPPQLTHLCRCRIREALFANWALPHGIKQLRIPESLKNYLDLLSD